MASDTAHDELAADLAVLGLSIIETTPNTDATLSVMARLCDAPTPLPASPPQLLLRRVAGALAGRRRRASLT